MSEFSDRLKEFQERVEEAEEELKKARFLLEDHYRFQIMYLESDLQDAEQREEDLEDRNRALHEALGRMKP